jgi:hypothetical protein
VNIRSGLVLLAFVFSAQAAHLQRETLSAWEVYVGAATAEMQERLRPDRHFLMLDEDQDSLSKVKNGEIIVLHNGTKRLNTVPSGLIHDWSGATFIPGATLNQVFSIMRDYDHYQDFYRPNVINSKTLFSNLAESRFSMILMSSSAVVNVAIAGDYRCEFFRVNERRRYSLSETTSVREIENYGAANQRELIDGQGEGLLWRLFSIGRFEQRDGGVYIELEAIALSRGIPISLRWLIEPIVNRVLRNSLMTTLRQTGDAVRSRPGLVSLSADTVRTGRP